VLDSTNVPPVASDEVLARFVVHSSHIRKSNNTVKPDAFMPHPRVELSLTRHRDATVEELWREGERIAAIRNAVLHARADVKASAFIEEDLIVEARPFPENPNHADALGWPADKPAQKMKATEIALMSKLVPKPN
jgi:hypothetical protein